MLDVCLHPDVEAELAKGQPLPHHRKDAVFETLRDRPRGITIPISGAFEPSGVCDQTRGRDLPAINGVWDATRYPSARSAFFAVLTKAAGMPAMQGAMWSPDSTNG